MRDDEDGGDAYDRFMAHGFDVPPDVCKPKAVEVLAILVMLAIGAVAVALIWFAWRFLRRLVGWWLFARVFGWW